MDWSFQRWLTIMDFKDIFLWFFIYGKQVFDYALILSWFYTTLKGVDFLVCFQSSRYHWIELLIIIPMSSSIQQDHNQITHWHKIKHLFSDEDDFWGWIASSVQHKHTPMLMPVLDKKKSAHDPIQLWLRGPGHSLAQLVKVSKS